jgi:uncharacterized protein YndB with AHSA1/START domain
VTQETAREVELSNSVRKVVSVKAPREVAWRVFTEQIGTWWPLATHKIGKTRAVDSVIEPRAGGRWYERGDDGSTCDWGRVLSWSPTSRIVLSWQITPDWQYDRNLKTEVEVRFIDERGGTRVELEHRHLDQYGPRRDEMRGIFDSERGWSGILASFARTAEA